MFVFAEIPFLLSLFSQLTQKLLLPDRSHQLAFLTRCIEVARPPPESTPQLVLPQVQQRRQLVWLLARSPPGSSFSMRMLTAFSSPRAQLGTSSSSPTAATLFEVQPTGLIYNFVKIVLGGGLIARRSRLVPAGGRQ
ncbi:hypothetical protein ACQJBY_068117 [Aegilops geniculata]